MTKQQKIKLYTGSYNAPVLTGDGSVYQGKGKGIQIFLFDEETGKLKEIESYPDVENASWMVFAPNRKTLYAVNELDNYQGTGGGALSALLVTETGRLVMQSCLPVMGAAPCHVDCDPSGGHVFTANYNGGSLSSFAVGRDGSLEAMDLQIIHHLKGDRREGFHRGRQEKAHVHSTAVFNGFLWVTDLGMDEISVYELDKAGNLVEETKEGQPQACYKVILPVGSGPRSLAFRKDGYVYVTCELSNKIGILRWEDHGIKVEGFVSCTPEEVAEEEQDMQSKRENLPGGLLLSEDEKFLYVGNRGHNSIAVFKMDKSGLIKGIQWIDSGGRNPRGFQLAPSGRWMIVANQDSDNLVVFQRDMETGMLTEHAKYEAGAVVCLEFL